MYEYDLIVIGSGPAGEKGAAKAAYFGKKVALIERLEVVGGACINTGTVPSKTLRESALHLSGLKQRGVLAVDMKVKDNISVADFMYRKQKVMEQEWGLIEENLRRHKIDRFHGSARFRSDHEIFVEFGESATLISGEVILIATGSSPFRPPHIPFDDLHVYDSDSILNLDRIPATLAVIGAGVIGCEYASIFAALGVKVFLVDGRTSLLPFIDGEVGKILIDQLSTRLSVELHLGADVKSVTLDGETVRIELEDGAKIAAEKLLFSAGRVSNTLDLDLPAAGVATGNRGVIPVNDHYQTNMPNVYAAGDVIGFPALASTSMEQARVAIGHAFNLGSTPHVATLLPYGIYTIPELSMVGLTEEQCREKGYDVMVGRSSYRNNPRGQIIGDTTGMIKLVFDAKTLILYGVHIVGENATELLHVGMMVMQFGGTIRAFIDSVFNYPTLGDVYKYAAYDGLVSIRKRELAESATAAV